MEEPKRKKLKIKSSKMNKQNSLHRPVPFDIMLKILSHLDDPFDLGACLFVSKDWSLAASQPCLWKKFVTKKFSNYFSHDDDCNWLQVYRNFRDLHIQEDLWTDIDDLEDTVSCPFCQSNLLPFEEDFEYYVSCDCNHQFRISVVTEQQRDEANKNYCKRHDLY